MKIFTGIKLSDLDENGQIRGTKYSEFGILELWNFNNIIKHQKISEEIVNKRNSNLANLPYVK